MYDLAAHGSMIADRARCEAYAAVLRRHVRASTRVLDLGTGIGLFAVLAAKLGAAVVDAVEPDGVVEIAREIARANGVSERIRFHQVRAQEITLPEPADVVIGDLRGVLPPHGEHFAVIADARRRHLAPGGLIAPRRDELRAAIVSSPDRHARLFEAWDAAPWDIDLSAGATRLSHRLVKVRLAPEEIATPARTWAEVDYGSVEAGGVGGTAAWTFDRAHTVHGVALWFRTELDEGIGYSSGPLGSARTYGQTFFAWRQAQRLRAGETVRVEIRRDSVGLEGAWRLKTTIAPPSAAPRRRLDHVTLMAVPLGLAQLGRVAHDHVPRPNREARVDRVGLAALDGTRTVSDLAEVLREAFPEHFPDEAAALTHAGRLSMRYGTVE